MEAESENEVHVTLTIDQIVEIFKAGMRRGEEEATAYDWGTTASGRASDDLLEALVEIGASREDAAKWIKGKL